MISKPIGPEFWSRVLRGSYSAFRRYWMSFSYVGLIVGTLFFAASVTPSLLPRKYLFQGLLSGFSIAAGYGLGVLVMLIYRYLELPEFSRRERRMAKRVTGACVGVVLLTFIWRMTVWQNSIRELMEMPELETAYPFRTGLIALVFAFVLIGLGRMFVWVCRYLERRLERFVPRRVALALGVVIAVTLVFLLTNDLIVKQLLLAADSFFLNLDEYIDDELQQPTGLLATGSEESLIAWSTVGRQGKIFVTTGPTQDDIMQITQRAAMNPIRVYVGMRTRETPRERAQLALEELKRVGGFERSVLVVATPTGTGWLDPAAVDTLEYLHAGDTAIVSTQYSYLPSWITILVDPQRSIESSQALFDEIYAYWTTLPADSRPRLYLQGLSLGSFGSETTMDLLSIFEDPIQGAVWSGPPFPSHRWQGIIQNRNSDEPIWRPTFRDSRIVRFTGQENFLDEQQPWGPIRTVYIQYASDPMVWFSPDLLWKRPAWLQQPRGPDVSEHLTWYPIITFLQVAFDLPMATSVPNGYGHNYSPASYLDAWVAVTAPRDWSREDTENLKAYFASREIPTP